MATTAERIKEALDISGMKQADLIRLTGINKGALSSYISGRYTPKQNNIYLIARALNVNEAWLMGLDVPMSRSSEALDTPVQLRQDEVKLLGLYNELNELGQNKVIEDTEDLTHLPKYTEREKMRNA